MDGWVKKDQVDIWEASAFSFIDSVEPCDNKGMEKDFQFFQFCSEGLLILGTSVRSIKKWGKMPPGPTPLPFIGNILQLRPNDVLNSFRKLNRKYGPVYMVYFGTQPVLILNGYDVVKEALVDNADVFGERGRFPGLLKAFSNNGIITTNGERWKQLRRFALTTMRNFGMGKRSIEERIQEEAQFLVKEMKKTKGSFFDPTFYLSRSTSNVISSIVFGNRFEYEDKEFLTLLKLLNQFAKLFDSPLSQEKQNNTSIFNDDNLVMSTLNLFFAGTETTSTTLRYGFLILMKYPEIAEKVMQEIDHVIGQNRAPSVEDRSKMPYTDAVIHEIQRFADIVPMNVPHAVAQDTEFQGYIIPKGTMVFPMLTTVLKDPQWFKNPYSFDPGNFMDENGAFKKNDAFMPFSAGKRICLGEGLARMELFLFFTTILQNFTLKTTKNPKDIDISSGLSSGNSPRSYQLCVQPRY
uniref:Cytochrome P450 2F2-like n=1 Tax=Geotrypetes seraphini TaxID=260995 RepID=A0A6P8RXZ5_GEOSA|nr:cytochrome P450 2F2-like [Geotrypetes seraphini]